ncbi:hypothetical protein [uncultured Flavobacterium sp.]|uniref:hypothetical protein n=1 Tax=uncultured Flavobacterium sp. TaxID=165435 RepID=UPI00308173AE
MKKRTVEEIVNESINYQGSFPDLNIIINAINEGHELNSRLVTYLLYSFIKEDDDLIKVIDLMIENNYEFDKFIVFELAINGFFKTMEHFKKMGFDLNIKNEKNENALFYVIQNGVAKNNYIDFLRTEDFIATTVDNCIRLGIDEKVINTAGRNLLHISLLTWCPDIYFDILLKLDLDINQIDNNGWTPFHLVCAYYPEDKLYKTFLQNGADKSIMTKNRITDFEEMFNLEPTPEICSAYDLRLYHLDSILSDLKKGSDDYNYNRNEIEIYLKPD